MTQKQFFEYFFRGGVLLLGVLSVAGYLGAASVYIDAASHFKLQYFVLGLCALFFFALTRQVRWGAASLAILLINLAVLLPWYLPHSPGSSTTTVPLRFLFANVLVENTNYERLKSVIRREQPDLIALAEASPAWRTALTDLEEVYPYSLKAVGPGQAGILMYSKLPLTPLAELESLDLVKPRILGATVKRARASFSAIVIHPLPPTSPAKFTSRNQLLAAIAAYGRDRPDPVVVLGDFNVSLWSPIHHRFTRDSGLHNARRGFGILPTWPAPWLPSLIPIDHCFVSSNIQVRAFRTAPYIGSDHLPIIADLSLPSS